MTREEAIQWLKHINITDFGWDDYAMQDSQKEIRERCEQSIKEAINMAIEALSKPNYETDTEVRLAVTNRKKEKVILWDAFGEVQYYPIEALQPDAVSRDVYDKRTQADEEIIDSYRQEFQKSISAETAQGEWKHTITWQPYCSNCEYVFGEDEEFSPFWKYCPMCGARMKGSAEE